MQTNFQNELGNITEICPSQRAICFKAPCQCSGWMRMQVNNQTKKLLTEETYNNSFILSTKQARTAPTQGIDAGALNR